MDAESIEKEIAGIKLKISEEKKSGQVKLVALQKVQNDLNAGATLILQWEAQVQVLQKVLDK